MAPVLGVESLDQRLKAGSKVLRPGGCIDRTRARSDQGYTEEGDRAQYTSHSEPLHRGPRRLRRVASGTSGGGSRP